MSLMADSTRSSKKRKSSDPHAHRARPPAVVNPGFVRSPESDVWIRDGSRTLYATQRIFLQAASSVFRDTFAKETPQETHDELAIFDLPEQGDAVALFLGYVHPGKLSNSDGVPFNLVFDAQVIHEVARMAEKYAAPLVISQVLNEHLQKLYGLDLDGMSALNALGLALIYKYEAHVTSALRSFDKTIVRDVGTSVRSRETQRPGETLEELEQREGHTEDSRDFNLSDMDPDILERLSIHHISEFCRVAGQVASRPGYTWRKASESFVVSVPALSSDAEHKSIMLTVTGRSIGLQM